VVLRCEVDEVIQLLTHQHVGRRVGRDDIGQRRRAGVDRCHEDRVVVGMSGAGDLPNPKLLAIRLPRAVVAPSPTAEKICFGDDGDERDTQVWTKLHRLGCAAVQHVESRAAVQWRGGPESRMHQEAVVDLGERVDSVDVCRQEQRGLRLTQSNDVFGL